LHALRHRQADKVLEHVLKRDAQTEFVEHAAEHAVADALTVYEYAVTVEYHQTKVAHRQEGFGFTGYDGCPGRVPRPSAHLSREILYKQCLRKRLDSGTSGCSKVTPVSTMLILSITARER